MYIHSNGSPQQGIPARPIIEPALEANKERLGTLMGAAVKSAMAGKATDMRNSLEKAGMAGASAAKNRFTDYPGNGLTKLSDERLLQRAQKATGGLKGETESSKKKLKAAAADVKPLLDTGALQASITYVLREKQ
jgi:hypothetical protein